MIIFDKFDESYHVEGLENFDIGNGNHVVVFNEKSRPIAEYDFDCLSNNDDEIKIIVPHIANVLKEYRRKGISSAVIKVIKETFPESTIEFLNAVNAPVEDDNDIHYTDDGIGFLEACCSKGIAINDLDNI